MPSKKIRLTEASVRKALPEEKRYDLRDETTPGLICRIETSGKKTWLMDYTKLSGGRGTKKIGDARILKVDQAREKAIKFLSSITMGIDPVAKEEKVMTVGALLDIYAPWVTPNRKTGSETVKTLRRQFTRFMDTPVTSLTPEMIEEWQSDELSRGLAGQSINRSMNAFQALLTWGARRGHVPINPIRGKVERLPETGNKKIRYLLPDERERLFKALDEREKDQGEDYFRLAVLFSLATGIRKGTLLQLTWEDVDMRTRTAILRGEIMKGGSTWTIPLSTFAFGILEAWKPKTNGTGFVFPGDGTRLLDIKKPWNNLMKRAKIPSFTWHCLRHDFASQLAMKGVNILTIKELLCHEKLEMTLVYAHLAPDIKRQALEQLGDMFPENAKAT